jgi:hypothetical protein
MDPECHSLTEIFYSSQSQLIVYITITRLFAQSAIAIPTSARSEFGTKPRSGIAPPFGRKEITFINPGALPLITDPKDSLKPNPVDNGRRLVQDISYHNTA